MFAIQSRSDEAMQEFVREVGHFSDIFLVPGANKMSLKTIADRLKSRTFAKDYFIPYC